jgi:hypothetical protein
MVATGETPIRPARITTDDTILKALGRAYRWKRKLESGEFASIGDLAAAEKINHAYVRRILRLTLLSPKITETILDGRQPRHLQLEDLLKPFPIEWALHADRFHQPLRSKAKDVCLLRERPCDRIIRIGEQISHALHAG